ncbi:MYPU_1760 family metalloprotease [[Mycoplasma] anseris]|uniref:Uncharacterized protein n=1 Tax=[Mycoplasma] anseris TaxID=92400 RepID=A0A2Z4ND66_9BACT|nr:hypothetical protein [[Mycoplasma] anseris]AWX69524.1 hypothetical protein DP065_02035 [[Mycoplasma] anseris]
MKKNKKSVTIFLIIFGILFGFGILAGLGYAAYLFVPSLIKSVPFWKVIANDESKSILYNQKYASSNKNEILKTYEYGNLSIKEYAYSVDEDGNPIYFLGPEGLKLLNEEFKKRAMYGPEINLLRNVYINKSSDIEKKANGYYLPSDDEIYLSISAIVDPSNYLDHDWREEKLSIKVDMVLAVLVHEYMHFVANSYNNNHRINDLNSDKTLEYNLDSSQVVKANYVNNKKFITEFRKYLGYNPSIIDQIPYYKNITPPENEINVFSKWSAYDLFELANLPFNASKNWNQLQEKNYYFNNSRISPTRFTTPADTEIIKYLYSFEELIPREFLKMSFPASDLIFKDSLFNFFPKDKSGWNNFLYYTNGDFFWVTAIGDDVLKSIGKGIRSEDLLFSTNWVFDKELAKLVNKQGIKIYNTAIYPANYRLKGLFKAYVDLYGYGQAISFLGNHSIDSQNESMHIGGFLPFDYDEKNIDKPTYLVLSNQQNQSIDLNMHIHANNFIAKKSYNEVYSEDMLKPDFLDYKIHKYSYFTDELTYEDINKYFNNQKFDAKIWIDTNKDNLKQEEELLPLNMTYNQLRFEETKRTITNFRVPMTWGHNILNNKTYQVKIEDDPLQKTISYVIKRY